MTKKDKIAVIEKKLAEKAAKVENSRKLHLSHKEVSLLPSREKR